MDTSGFQLGLCSTWNPDRPDSVEGDKGTEIGVGTPTSILAGTGLRFCGERREERETGGVERPVRFSPSIQFMAI